MESNIANQKLWRPDSPLAEPHFNEEATLLSARPVVPIGELTAKAGFSRPWIFGLAVAGALILGVSATALYYSRFRTTEPQSAGSIETVSSGVQGVAPEPVVLNELHTEAKVTKTDSPLVGSVGSARGKAQAPSVLLATRPPHSSSSAVPKKAAHRRGVALLDQSPEFEYETRSERRAARREAKEFKRANRERRAGKHPDEVLRIREIFEGPARP